MQAWEQPATRLRFPRAASPARCCEVPWHHQRRRTAPREAAHCPSPLLLIQRQAAVPSSGSFAAPRSQHGAPTRACQAVEPISWGGWDLGRPAHPQWGCEMWLERVRSSKVLRVRAESGADNCIHVNSLLLWRAVLGQQQPLFAHTCSHPKLDAASRSTSNGSPSQPTRGQTAAHVFILDDLHLRHDKLGDLRHVTCMHSVRPGLGYVKKRQVKAWPAPPSRGLSHGSTAPQSCRRAWAGSTGAASCEAVRCQAAPVPAAMACALEIRLRVMAAEAQLRMVHQGEPMD